MAQFPCLYLSKMTFDYPNGLECGGTESSKGETFNPPKRLEFGGMMTFTQRGYLDSPLFTQAMFHLSRLASAEAGLAERYPGDVPQTGPQMSEA